MDNSRIVVPFRDAHLILTLPEAQQLFGELQTHLQKARDYRDGLHSPTISDDGYLDVDAFYAFFAQIYSEPGLLRSHAGRLFGRITAAAHYSDIPFNVVCKKCYMPTTTVCTQGNNLHRSCAKDLKIEAASLKEYGEKFLEIKSRMVGPSAKEDLKILLRYL